MTKEQFDASWEYFRANHDGRFELENKYPILNEDSGGGHVYCPTYVYFEAWAARILMETRPAEHVDFGGQAYFAGIASAICPFRYYDIHLMDIRLPNVTVGKADLTNLPFRDGELNSVSCGHVLEHCGLGRYSDTLDVQGDLKAARELIRVTGKQLLMVLPLSGRPKIEFNAHRIYTYDQVIDMFSGLELKEFALMDVPEYIRPCDPDRARKLDHEAAGCFLFAKD